MSCATILALGVGNLSPTTPRAQASPQGPVVLRLSHIRTRTRTPSPSPQKPLKALIIRRSPVRQARWVGTLSTKDSQHGPLCKNSVSCFLDGGEEEEEEEEMSTGKGSSGSPPNGSDAPRPQTSTSNGSRLPLPRWEQMTTEDFRVMKNSAIEPIAILPVSAIEQHGPHLPCSVDRDINEGIIKKAMELVDPALPVTLLPTQAVGKSDEHSAFPGTLTISADTLTRLWLDIGDSVHQAGINKLVIFNSHGGQPQVMDVVARELRIRHGMLVVVLSWFGFGLPDKLISRHEQTHGIHGGEIETSMMLHLQPQLVRMQHAQNFVSSSEALEKDFKHLLPEGGVGFGWMSQDLNTTGAIGDARGATAEKGRALVDHAAEKLVELLSEVDRFPLSFFTVTAGGQPVEGDTTAQQQGTLEQTQLVE